jgi:hypothetical protein
VLAKTLEKIVHKQVSEYLDKFNILNCFQSGFRKGHSTVTTLACVTDAIRESIDNRELSLLILFDFSKAFDRVHHKLLLAKLKHLGFSQSVLAWFDEYLSNRLQQVWIDSNTFSSWAHVGTGVPQGSVLGPLLYILYVNDISLIFKYGKVHLYADDLQYHISFRSGRHNEAVQCATSDAEELSLYARKHNLDLNGAKTQPIFLGSRKYLNMIDTENLQKVSIDGAAVQYCETVLNLGIVMDQTLSWGAHVSYVCKKVFAILSQLRRDAYYLPLSVKKSVVMSLIQPHIDYASVIMSDMNVVYKIRMQRLQNACVRYIFNLPRDAHISQYYQNLTWLKLEEKRKWQVALMLWNVFRNKRPSYLYEKFVFRSSVNARPMRNDYNLLIVPHHRTDKYSKSFLVNACKVWNALKLSEIIHLSYTSYKFKVKNMLLRM